MGQLLYRTIVKLHLKHPLEIVVYKYNKFIIEMTEEVSKECQAQLKKHN